MAITANDVKTLCDRTNPADDGFCKAALTASAGDAWTRR